MAVTKDLTKATPYEDANSKVAKWELEYTYENDSEGDATYYKSVFKETIEQAYTDSNGDAQTNFTLQAKGDFSKADLVALCSIAQWDAVFASQVDSVITNPVTNPTADESFSVPS
tara:strand:+ start:86 stop:430 length:345 start_codon:yes stop_codon:yes gene_type:complete